MVTNGNRRHEQMLVKAYVGLCQHRNAAKWRGDKITERLAKQLAHAAALELHAFRHNIYDSTNPEWCE